MNFKREDLFNMPWSNTDNAGAWIEVTDRCNLNCEGCFRKNGLDGHKPLKAVKEDILFSIKSTNCSRICISGGEPLLYPHIFEVIRFITAQNVKAIILSNGELLTPAYARELKKAGLYQVYLHVDSNQGRPGWVGKTEKEMNELRLHYANILFKAHIKCGYNLTIRHANLDGIDDIVEWCRSNISKVGHLSLITFRGIPAYKDYQLYACGKVVDPSIFSNYIVNDNEINLDSLDIYEKLEESFSHIHPCAYLHGTSKLDTYKMLIINNIGSDREIYGAMGGKTIALYQSMQHLLYKKYDATVPSAGKTVFFLAFIDKMVAKALWNYLKAVLRNPIRLFESVHVQSVNIQQPFEFIDHEVNLCEGCVNLMPYKGQMINSCRLDEYRLVGGPLSFRKVDNTASH